MKKREFNLRNIAAIEDVELRTFIRLVALPKGGVKALQRVLRTLGENIAVDGWFGRKTLDAVRRYRYDNLYAAIASELSGADRHNLNKTSLKRLVGVHPDIVKVVKRASLYAPIFVVEGLREKKRQKRLRKIGKSQTNNSYHRYGLAVDLVLLKDGKIDWNSKMSYKKVWKAINKAEIELGMDVLDNAMFDLHWRTITDYPHWQMNTRYVPNRNPRKYYAKMKDVGFIV